MQIIARTLDSGMVTDGRERTIGKWGRQSAIEFINYLFLLRSTDYMTTCIANTNLLFIGHLIIFIISVFCISVS